MTTEHVILVFVGVVGLLQGIGLVILRVGMGKVTLICARLDDMQKQLAGKTDVSDHKKVQVTLGEYGDRILTLELAVKVIEKEK